MDSIREYLKNYAALGYDAETLYYDLLALNTYKGSGSGSYTGGYTGTAKKPKGTSGGVTKPGTKSTIAIQ